MTPRHPEFLPLSHEDLVSHEDPRPLASDKPFRSYRRQPTCLPSRSALGPPSPHARCTRAPHCPDVGEAGGRIGTRATPTHDAPALLWCCGCPGGRRRGRGAPGNDAQPAAGSSAGRCRSRPTPVRPAAPAPPRAPWLSSLLCSHGTRTGADVAHEHAGGRAGGGEGGGAIRIEQAEP